VNTARGRVREENDNGKYVNTTWLAKFSITSRDDGCTETVHGVKFCLFDFTTLNQPLRLYSVV